MITQAWLIVHELPDGSFTYRVAGDFEKAKEIFERFRGENNLPLRNGDNDGAMQAGDDDAGEFVYAYNVDVEYSALGLMEQATKKKR